MLASAFKANLKVNVVLRGKKQKSLISFMNSNSFVNCFVWNHQYFEKFAHIFLGGGGRQKFYHRFMYIASPSHYSWLTLNMPFRVILRRFEVVFWCIEWECWLFKRLLKIYSNPPILYYGFNPIETIVAFMRRAIAFLSGPWAHICDENKGFTQTPVTFLSLRPLVLSVASFESVYSALSDDVWYCSGWYWKFLRNIDLKSRHVKCVRSAWPECGSLRQLYNVCVYGAGSLRQLFNVCTLWSYNLSRVFSFPR